MAAGLPKDPVKRLRSVAVSFLQIGFDFKRGAPRRNRPHAVDASHAAAVGGFSLRGGARPASV